MWACQQAAGSMSISTISAYAAWRAACRCSCVKPSTGIRSPQSSLARFAVTIGQSDQRAGLVLGC